MEKDIKLKYTVITDKTVMVCGRTLGHDHSGAAMLAEIYRAHVGDWPKFFKMDTLSKAGFLASELLLKELCERGAEGEEYVSGRAIVLFGATASLCADRNYQETIQDSDNYYPSPALFVYTLPNIVTGEIAIRNHYRGETSFYVLDGYDSRSMVFHLQCAFQDSVTESVLAGWVDSTGNDDFRCFFTLLKREDTSNPEGLERELKGMMEILESNF